MFSEHPQGSPLPLRLPSSPRSEPLDHNGSIELDDMSRRRVRGMVVHHVCLRLQMPSPLILQVIEQPFGDIPHCRIGGDG